MLDYHFNLTTSQPASNPGLSILQEKLIDAGIFLDFTYKNGNLGLYIRIEDANLIPKKPLDIPKGLLDSENSTNPADSVFPVVDPSAPVRSGDEKPRRGRRPAVPERDLTLAQVRDMKKSGVGLDEIAHLIGVSRRTFFRRWATVQDSCPDPRTPFSKWTDR